MNLELPRENFFRGSFFIASKSLFLGFVLRYEANIPQQSLFKRRMVKA